MKRITLFVVTLLFQLIICSNPGLAQEGNQTTVTLELTIPPIALINFAVENNEVISHSFSLSSNQAEQLITKTNMDKTWLNYSSIVRPGSTNYITANISSGALPSDVSLHVFVSPDAGKGAGALGTPIGNITLTNYPQNLIINIGSCYTGSGINKGCLLNYVWDNPESYNYSIKYLHRKPISVTYTITAH
ncbi:MAG: hypothetical protein JXR71_09610 [Bacteroidales bacterium]|nr:hypothetical protein [Bacteroidales bacterium]